MIATAVARDHPADRILEIVNKLQEEARSNATRWQTERQQLQEKIAGLQRPTDAGALPAKVDAEITRIQSMVADINQKLGDPELELSAEIRLNRERAELEAYLKGLRYSLHGA